MTDFRPIMRINKVWAYACDISYGDRS